MTIKMKPVRGPERDAPLRVSQVAILRVLARYFYLSVVQLLRVLGHSPGSLTYVQTNVKGLLEAGYLQRLYLPRAGGHGSSPAVYTLTARGKRYLAGFGVGVPGRYRPSEEAERGASTFFIPHTLAVNDFLISAELFAKGRSDVTLESVIHERELRREPVYVEDGEGRKLPIVPDGWLDLRLEPEAQMCLVLEMDRGTVEQRAWRRKVRSLLSYTRGPYQEQFGTTSITVAVVAVPGERRLASLRRWTEAELADCGEDERDLFRLTALSPAAAAPEELFLAPVWYRPGSAEPVALLEGVSPRAHEGVVYSGP